VQLPIYNISLVKNVKHFFSPWLTNPWLGRIQLKIKKHPLRAKALWNVKKFCQVFGIGVV